MCVAMRLCDIPVAMPMARLMPMSPSKLVKLCNCLEEAVNRRDTPISARLNKRLKRLNLLTATALPGTSKTIERAFGSP